MVAATVTPRRAVLTTWSATAVVAIVVAVVPGAASATRDALRLTFDSTPGSFHEAFGILLHNAEPTALLLLLSLLRGAGALRAAIILMNIAPVGAALGAYRVALLAWATHLPLELTALALAGAPNADTRRALTVLALLLVAAGLESAMPSIIG